ncbi:MAG: 5'/3'-nucleotidase SurE [Elusimicrobia bacterium]|nr:5'/3'-nucleotidase SurE [Elusimicrobiota bacterium]
MTRSRRPRILVVNDDGIHGIGLLPLIAVLSGLGEVTAVVPERERSADSHCLTLRRPLRVTLLRPGLYMADGSPADCARIGALEIVKRPDLAVSGVNNGFNLGSDVIYSGTVAGATEATLLGIPALSVSRGQGRTQDFRPASELAGKIAAQILRRGLPQGVCLNLNVPPLSGRRLRGVRITALGRRIYGKKVTARRDPYGAPYYWLAGRYISGFPDKGTDVTAVRDGFASLTPLHVDNTHRPTLKLLKRWDL